MSRKQRFYWHVPHWSNSGAPLTLGTDPLQNDAVGNIIGELINSDFAPTADPRQDNFVCERIIGQYLLVAPSGAEGGDRMVHHRVYVAQGDQTTLDVRNLFEADDANTSFLWHKTEGFDSDWVGQPWGTWAVGSTNTPAPAFLAGRKGSFDIRVGRRIEEGTSLIWHTQFDTGGVTINTWLLHLWCRVLMREG